MQKILLVLSVSFILISCNSKKSNSASNSTDAEKEINSTKDEETDSGIFLKNNSLNADVNGEHIVYDSVFAYRLRNSEIIINGFDRKNHRSIALLIGKEAYNSPDKKGEIGTNQYFIDGNGNRLKTEEMTHGNSDATIQINQNLYSTKDDIFHYIYSRTGEKDIYTGWRGAARSESIFGTGKGLISNINYTQIKVGNNAYMNGFSGNFNFTAIDEDISDGKRNTHGQAEVINGKVVINRIIDLYGEDAIDLKFNTLLANKTL